jgi:hypothetical protein
MQIKSITLLLPILLWGLVSFGMEKENQQPKNAAKAAQLRAQYDDLENKIRRNAPKQNAQAGECVICLEDRPANQMNACSCGTTICNTCIGQLAQQHRHDPSQIVCTNKNCKRPLPFERIVDPAALNELRENFRKEVTAAHPDGKFCPTPNCQHHFIDATPKNRFRLMNCPQCNQQYCVHCLINHEERIRCEQARKAAQNPENEEWLKNNTQPCPICTRAIERDGGCVNMYCPPPCNTNFTWIPTEAEKRQGVPQWGFNIHGFERDFQARENERNLRQLQHELAQARRNGTAAQQRNIEERIRRIEAFIQREADIQREMRGPQNQVPQAQNPLFGPNQFLNANQPWAGAREDERLELEDLIRQIADAEFFINADFEAREAARVQAEQQAQRDAQARAAQQADIQRQQEAQRQRDAEARRRGARGQAQQRLGAVRQNLDQLQQNRQLAAQEQARQAQAFQQRMQAAQQGVAQINADRDAAVAAHEQREQQARQIAQALVQGQAQRQQDINAVQPQAAPAQRVAALHPQAQQAAAQVQAKPAGNPIQARPARAQVKPVGKPIQARPKPKAVNAKKMVAKANRPAPAKKRAITKGKAQKNRPVRRARGRTAKNGINARRAKAGAVALGMKNINAKRKRTNGNAKKAMPRAARNVQRPQKNAYPKKAKRTP